MNAEEANALYDSFKKRPSSSIDHIKQKCMSEVNKNLNEEVCKFRDLVQQMLQPNPNQRPVASQLLKHPLFCENNHQKLKTMGNTVANNRCKQRRLKLKKKK